MSIISTAGLSPLIFTPDVRQAARSAVGAAEIAQSETLEPSLQATSQMESAQALLDATFPTPNTEMTILTAHRGFFSTALLPDASLIPTSTATDLLSAVSTLYLLP